MTFKGRGGDVLSLPNVFSSFVSKVKELTVVILSSLGIFKFLVSYWYTKGSTICMFIYTYLIKLLFSKK